MSWNEMAIEPMLAIGAEVKKQSISIELVAAGPLLVLTTALGGILEHYKV